MSIIREFDLCLNAGTRIPRPIHVNQYDSGEVWVFNLYTEDGTPYIPSSGAIVGIKSDAHGIINSGSVNSAGQVVINETKQMTAAAGTAIFELSIDGSTHGTANFKVVVERKPGDNADMSESDFSGLQQAIDAAAILTANQAQIEALPDNLAQIAEDMQTTAEYAESSATHDANALAEAQRAEAAATRAESYKNTSESLKNQSATAASNAMAYRDTAKVYRDEVIEAASAVTQSIGLFVDADGYISASYN